MKQVLNFCELFDDEEGFVNIFKDLKVNGNEDKIIFAKFPLNVTIAADSETGQWKFSSTRRREKSPQYL